MNQQIINSIVTLTVNCVTAMVVLCIKFFDKKTLNKFLKDIDQRNTEVIEKLSSVQAISARSGDTMFKPLEYNEPITPSEKSHSDFRASEHNEPIQPQQKMQVSQHIIPLDTNRNLIIKTK